MANIVTDIHTGNTPMITQLVKINFDPPEEIEKLHGIGMKLAERIVLFRTAHGYFLQPEDLAKVEGIGLNLAITLSPSIDWQVPKSFESEKKLDWITVVIILASILVSLWGVIDGFQSLSSSTSDFLMGYSFSWVFVWINASLLLSLLSFFAFTVFISLGFIVKSRSLERKYHYFAFWLLIPAIAGLISSGLGNFVRYQYYETQGWSSLLNNHPAIIAIMWFMGFLLYVSPLLTVLWRPSQVASARLAKVFDVGLVTLAVATSIQIFFGDDIPWLILIINFIFGLSFMAIGINSIRTGHSFYLVMLETFSILDRGSQKATTSKRLAWLNRHLPNPEEQRELKEALNKAYPPSRIRNLLSTIVLGAGGWLIVTTVGAVIQWFIEKYLNTWFP